MSPSVITCDSWIVSWLLLWPFVYMDLSCLDLWSLLLYNGEYWRWRLNIANLIMSIKRSVHHFGPDCKISTTIWWGWLLQTVVTTWLFLWHHQLVSGFTHPVKNLNMHLIDWHKFWYQYPQWSNNDFGDLLTFTLALRHLWFLVKLKASQRLNVYISMATEQSQSVDEDRGIWWKAPEQVSKWTYSWDWLELLNSSLFRVWPE